MTTALLGDTIADPFVGGQEAGTLRAIRDRETALAIWTREAPLALAQAIDATSLDSVDDLDLPVSLSTPLSVLADDLAAGGYGDEAARLLAGDIVSLVTLFAAVTEGTLFTLRLHVVEGDACRRFHADYVTYRLLTTYSGRGTEWVRADQPEAIERMRPFQIALFKGRLLLDEAPILHRSPPIEGTGEQRLLLVINPVSDC